MRKIISSLVLFLIVFTSNGQNVGIGTATPHPSAALDISDSSKGILIPRMTMIQRNNIQNPAEGLMVYQTDSSNGYWYFNKGIWKHFLDNQSNKYNSNFSGVSGCYNTPVIQNQLTEFNSNSDITFDKPVLIYKKFTINRGHTVRISPQFGYLIIKADSVIINGIINGNGVWTGNGNGGGSSGSTTLATIDNPTLGNGLPSIIANGMDTVYGAIQPNLVYPANGNTPNVYQKNLSIDFRDKLMGASAPSYGGPGGAKGGGGLIIVCNYFKLSGPTIGFSSAEINVEGGRQSQSSNNYFGLSGGGGGGVLICSPIQIIEGIIKTSGGLAFNPQNNGNGGDGWFFSVH